MTPRPMYMQIPVEEYEKLNKRIADLEKENESLKYSVATLDTDIAMMNRWCKVSEEKPPEGVDVLIYDGDTIYLAYMEFMADGQIWFWPPNSPHVEGVTHWMPLPEPPEVR